VASTYCGKITDSPYPVAGRGIEATYPRAFRLTGGDWWEPGRAAVENQTLDRVVESPPSEVCPRPGYNGSHFYIEVDPASFEPAADTGYLRCRWCGAMYQACLVPGDGGSTRVVRETSVTEAFRPVREATW